MVVFNHITFVNCVGVVLNLRTSFSPFGIGIFGGQNSLKNQDFDSQPNSTKLLVEEAQPFEPNQTKLPCQPVGGPNSIQTKVNPGHFEPKEQHHIGSVSVWRTENVCVPLNLAQLPLSPRS